MYGMMYGMHRTTVYLPDDTRQALARAAKRLGLSEAQLIRDALDEKLKKLVPPEPRLPLFRSNQRGLAERVDEALEGFGER
jgi:hypothetical protein